MHEKLIFDIGFHKGEDTAHYLSKGYKVVAVDANPLLIKEGGKVFEKEIAAGQLQLLNIGIGEKDEPLDFYVNGQSSEWSSFVKEIGIRGDKGFEVVRVPCKPISWLFEQYGVPYYMKIDIEGCDEYCVGGIRVNEKPLFVSCEATDIALLDMMFEKGYRKFKCIDQSDKFEPLDNKVWEHPLYRKLKRGFGILTGSRWYHTYKVGSSGPFGNATKGNWKEYEQVRKEFLYFHQNNPTGKPLNERCWFDFHAAY